MKTGRAMPFNIVVLDKPERRGYGNLQVFKVSTHSKLDEAKEKAIVVESKLKNLEWDYHFPIIGFLNDKEFRASEEYGYDDIGDKIRHTLNQSLWTHSLDLYVGEADNYLRPFDIIEISRGAYRHYAIYLGKGYICHFSGDKVGSSGSGSMKVEKSTLRNLFEGDTHRSIKIIRRVVKFKSKDKIIENIARAIASEYGKNQYDLFENNCEHFANMITLGINYSGQGNGLKAFTSGATSLKREVKECGKAVDSLASSLSSKVNELVSEIRGLAQEANRDGLGDWEARIEVHTKPLNNMWCKIQ